MIRRFAAKSGPSSVLHIAVTRAPFTDAIAPYYHRLCGQTCVEKWLMEIETRLLEEWKANNDLLKFYEDLKQKRFAHFLTIQTAFLAFFALLAKDALLSLSMVSLTALVIIAIPPLIISFYFMRVDTRSRAFVDTTNTRLLLIEDEWRGVSPDSHFSTYQQLFAILSRHDEETVEKYLRARNLKGDPFERLALSKSAHASEHAILRMFWWLWIVLAGMTALIHLTWHLFKGFGVVS
jgi:hypothetical protein